MVQCSEARRRQRNRLALLALAISVSKMENEKKTYTKKRFWVHPIFAKRSECGFFHAVLPTLQLEEVGFRNYFRMSASQLEELLGIVGPQLQKQPICRDAISPKERLCLTLRFVQYIQNVCVIVYYILLLK